MLIGSKGPIKYSEGHWRHYKRFLGQYLKNAAHKVNHNDLTSCVSCPTISTVVFNRKDKVILGHVRSCSIDKWRYLTDHCGSIVTCDGLHAALTERGVVCIVCKLRPNISEVE